MFIIGYLRGECSGKVFPITESNSKTLKQVIGGSQGNRVYSDEGLAVTQASLAGGQGAKTGLTSTFRGQPDGDGRPAVAVLTPDRLNKRQNGRRFKEDGEPMFTLTGQDKHGVSDGTRIRRLTPVECARLQGFPDRIPRDGYNCIFFPPRPRAAGRGCNKRGARA